MFTVLVGAILQLFMISLIDLSVEAIYGNLTVNAMNISKKVHYDAEERSTSDAFCQSLYANVVKCTDSGVQLAYGFCATYSGENNSYVTYCPYFEPDGHDVIESGYIRLPDNVSDLND